MKKLISLSIVALLFGMIAATPLNAQIKGVGKNIKKNVPSTNSNSKELSKDCEYLKKDLDRKVSTAERYMDEGRYKNAKNYVLGLKNKIEEARKEPCPYVAIYQKKYEEIEARYNEGLIKENPMGYLMQAVKDNDLDLANEALAAGADINQEDSRRKSTVLIEAIQNNNIEFVKFAVEKGADVNLASGYPKDETPLAYAVKKENKEICAYLISKGAKNEGAVNVMLVAANVGNLEIFKLLVSKMKTSAYVVESDKKRRPYKLEQLPSTLCIAQKNQNKDFVAYIESEVKKDNLAQIKDPIHKKFVNRIVFSTKEIPATQANESSFKNKLIAADGIYGRIFLETNLHRVTLGNGGCKDSQNANNYSVSVTLEGSDTEYVLASNSDSEAVKDLTSIPFTLNTDEDMRFKFHRLFLNLKDGENKAIVEVFVRNGDKHHTFNENIVLVKKPGDEYKAGKTFADFKAGMTDPKLEAGILKTIQSYASNAGWDEKFSKVKIKSTDWDILRHKTTGVIIGRAISAYCYAKWPDGHCTVQTFAFKQEYNGSGYNESFRYHYTHHQYTVDCD